MKYMLLIHGTENSWTQEERKNCMIESMRVDDQLAAKGKYIASSPLQSVKTAATVRVRDGKPIITNGPFAETTEQLGGYYLLDLANLDEAIEVASRIPPVTKGTVEIRPLLELDGLPPTRPVPDDSNLTPFMFICYDDETALQKANPVALREATALAHELNNAGQYLNASPLQPTTTAKCVRVRAGKREIIDGPFTETNEVLGGFYLVLADSRDGHSDLPHGTPEPGMARLKFGRSSICLKSEN